jgi:hypothetical protein
MAEEKNHMEKLAEVIKHNRPHLSASSIKTYSNCLKNLSRMVWGANTNVNHKLFFADSAKVMKVLEGIKYNVRKTYLSAIVAISKGENEKVVSAYHQLMMNDAEHYNNEQKENKMTEHQKENWMSWEEILQKRDKLKDRVWWVLNESDPDRENLLELQKYIITCCYTLIPPRRAKDFSEMKCRDYDEAKDNYYHKGVFTFNDYKTSRFYGKQTVRVPKVLELMLGRWIKKIPADQEYLFSDYEGKKLTSSTIGKILISVFKKKISVNMLRHAYITDNLAPKIKELEDEAKDMGQSTGQQKLYIKQ